MPNRVLKDSIRCSFQIDSLTWFQEVMFYRLMVTVDDFGRYYANPQIIKSELFPLKEDVTRKSVEDALDALEKNGLIRRYRFDDKDYLEFVTWAKHQQRRAKQSKFPDVNGSHVISDDIKCDHVISDDIKGHHVKSNETIRKQMSPNTNTNTNTKSKTKTIDDPLADDEEMIFIQGEHDELFDMAKKIGLPLTDQNMSEIVRLYAEHGKDTVMNGLSEASRLNKISIAYIEAVCKNAGKGKPEGDNWEDDVMAHLA